MNNASSPQNQPGNTQPTPQSHGASNGADGTPNGQSATGGLGSFEEAAAFGQAMANGETTQEDIYAWEHGVAVKPWAEPVAGSALLDELESLFPRLVKLPRWTAIALALFVVHTYAYRLRQVAVYLGIESPEKRCGKTTLLRVLCKLVNRPVVASSISSPAFYRVIERKEPTLLIDEADVMLHGNRELRGILNAGYTPGTGYVIRVEKRRRRASNAKAATGNGAAPGNGNGSETALAPEPDDELGRYSCWCPKVIAAIKHLPETLEDRCIIIPMQRKSPAEKCERLCKLNGKDLRRKCARFVMDHAPEIAAAEPEIPEDLNDRAAEIWEPLFVIADLAGGEWPEKARKAAVALTASAQDESPIAALLLDLMVLFVKQQCVPGNEWMQERGAARIFSRDLVAALNAYTDRPWSVLKRGKQITELWLAQQLRPYGIQSRTIWIGESAAKGYLEEEFTEVFRRYVPKSAIQAFLEEARAAEKPKPEDEEKPQDKEHQA